jgi:UDP:flavonoid glycosyltransferase YjiC (YdhE family)
VLISIYGDQALNIAKVISAGVGVLLEFNGITTGSVLKAVQEVLENPRYPKLFIKELYSK